MRDPHVRLRAYWTGPPPDVGHFLMAARGRTAYEITGRYTISLRRWRGRHNYVFVCRRWNPADVPKGSTIHAWKWDRRDPRHRPS